MGKIDLTSPAWCDLIFEGKNKLYGAYYIRRNSYKRYNASVIIVLILTFFVFAVPMLMNMLFPKDYSQSVTAVADLSDLEEAKIDNQEALVPQESVPVILGNTKRGKGDKVPAPSAVKDPNAADEPVIEPSNEVRNPKKIPSISKNESNETEVEDAREKATARIVNSKMAGAFGRGNAMNSAGYGHGGKGTLGSREGNASYGRTSGVGKGNGTFSLDGRTLASALPRPGYSVQDEGTVVVSITVSPSGRVISVSINKRTNTTNASLRHAALNAAKQARFNSINGVNNQQGTIMYHFKLK